MKASVFFILIILIVCLLSIAVVVTMQQNGGGCIPKCSSIISVCGDPLEPDGCGNTCPCTPPCVPNCDKGCGLSNGCSGICTCATTETCVNTICVKNASMSLSSADVSTLIHNVHPFDTVSQYGAIKAAGGNTNNAVFDPVLVHYVSVEYDPSLWTDVFTSGTPVLQDVLYWFSKTLDQCNAGDCLIINGDFLSIDSGALNAIATKINQGMRFILVLDRWEISGVPLYGSVEGQSWSPAQSKQGNGCPTCDSNGCDQGTNDFPYECCGSVAGLAKGQYCNDMNNVIQTIRQLTQNGKYASNFSIIDAATTKVGSVSSRQAPLHNHRHMTTFYMPSKNVASIFKGSWNFTGGVPNDNVTVPGQKESGLVITAALDNAVIQSDLAINYYWLTTLSVYVQGDVSVGVIAPATFTVPRAPLFVYLLGMIAARYIDLLNDQITFELYGKTYEVYGFVRSGAAIYMSADPASKISLGISPPPSSALTPSVEVPNPTPWETVGSTMLDRVVNDGYSNAAFNTMWPSLSCVSNTNQFLYPYASTYANNPVPAEKWRVPLNSTAPHCSSNVAPHAKSKHNIKTKKQTQRIRSSLGTCTAVTLEGGVGAACFTSMDSKGVSNLIPNGGCYNIDGTDYECAARIPWAPGAFWIGGLMYKFWKNASTTANRSVYVNMYSSMIDSGTGCILNCSQGNSGGQSAWNSGILTSSQYKFDRSSVIDSQYWYSKADSNSIQNVLDFLGVTGSELSIIGGQWSNMSTGVDVLTLYKNKAASAESQLNYKLYHAQKLQSTASGEEAGASKTIVDKNGNPVSGNNWERNHTKCYLSKDSILSSSGHPYNGGVNDWGGINECVLIENCQNLCKPLRVNFEVEYKYSNTVNSSSTFPWASAWAGMDFATPIANTVLNTNGWEALSAGGLFSMH